VSRRRSSTAFSGNTGFISTEVAPFGGVEELGIGREGLQYELEERLELEYLCIGGVA
jgi:succinate-semialdehyde dehydrogenase/glutarate-semialdehyde dehydrogenase